MRDLEAQEEELLEVNLVPDQMDVASGEREQAIRQAAYETYVRRDGAPGSELDDWLEAERSVWVALATRRTRRAAPGRALLRDGGVWAAADSLPLVFEAASDDL